MAAYLHWSVDNHLPDYTVSSQTLVKTSSMKEPALKIKTVLWRSLPWRGIYCLLNVGNHLLDCTVSHPKRLTTSLPFSNFLILSKRTLAS
jgi:hypothetical protein